MTKHFEKPTSATETMKTCLIQQFTDSRVDFPRGMSLNDITQTMYDNTPSELDHNTRTMLTLALNNLLAQQIIKQNGDYYQLIIH